MESREDEPAWDLGSYWDQEGAEIGKPKETKAGDLEM